MTAILILLGIVVAIVVIVMIVSSCNTASINACRREGLSQLFTDTVWTTGNSTLVCDSRHYSAYAIWKTPTGRFFKTDYENRKITVLEVREALAAVTDFAEPTALPMLIETFFDAERMV